MTQTAAPDDVAFYDVYSRRKRGTGELYLRDARLMVEDGFVVLTEGSAERVPARIAHLLNQRPDFYIVASHDQTPPPVVESALAPALHEDDFEPIPGEAVRSPDPQAIARPIDPQTGHRVKPERPVLTETELAARKANGQAYLDQLPPNERGTTPAAPPPAPPTPPVAKTTHAPIDDQDLPRTMQAADGQPIEIPVDVELGVTPGWPTDEHGRPLRLSDQERNELAQIQIGDSQDIAVPIPEGFAPLTADNERRCLAAKADGGQCQNPATAGLPSCNTQGHPQKVEALVSLAPA